jgi:hypothetical protein
LRAAATKARVWLEHCASEQRRDRLIDLGIWLCAVIHKPYLKGPDVIAVTQNVLPAPLALVEMERQELLALAQAVTLSGGSTQKIQVRDRECSARIFGGIALSYARCGDLVAVAAVVRMAASLELQGPWLTAALRHLLDQQQPNGSFGLLAPELALLEDPKSEPQVTARLTVEVLWALAEVAVARYKIQNSSRRHSKLQENRVGPKCDFSMVLSGVNRGAKRGGLPSSRRTRKQSATDSADHAAADLR